MPGTGGRLLVGLGDDEASWAALRWALGRAAREGAAVDAVRALGAGADDGTTSACAGGTDAALRESEAAALRCVARRVAGDVGSADVPPVSLSWRRGRPADVLPAAAREADALVVGCPGRSGRTLRAVLDRAACPVTVVRPAVASAVAGRGRVVVVGVEADRDTTADEVRTALREALRHARPADRVVVVAGFVPAPERLVWPRGHRPSPTVDEHARTVREATRAAVGPVVEDVRREHEVPDQVPVEVLAWPQGPRRAVLAVGYDLAADELVVPAGRGESPAQVLRLVRVAPCPVTVVPGARGEHPAPAGVLVSRPRSAPAPAGGAASGSAAR